jgi:type IV pilus assembly protein PilC
VIAAGERSGNLTGVLEQYISYLRVTTGFRSRLITALIYPAVLVMVAIIVVTYLATYALPQFATLYQQLNVPLPTSTRILLSIALPLRNYFVFLVAAIVAGSAGLFLWTRSDRGAIAIDRIKPRIPVFGDIWIKAQIAQFVRTLADFGRGDRQPAHRNLRGTGVRARQGRADAAFEPGGDEAGSRPGAGDD